MSHYVIKRSEKEPHECINYSVQTDCMYLVLRPVLKCHSQGYYSVTTSKQNRPGVSAPSAAQRMFAGTSFSLMITIELVFEAF